MTALISVGNRRGNILAPPNGKVVEDWKRHVWSRIVAWLTEPISFPGKWPAMDRQPARYNRVKGNHHP